MDEREPNLVTSALSRNVTQDGITVELCIYRLETKTEWALEVVTSDGASIVWDNQFPSDEAANAEFLRTIDEEGVATFLDDAKIMPFPR